jgi:general secretion pathway protein M
MNEIKVWFSQLAEREQMMVMAGGIFLLVALVYMLVIQPLFSGVTRIEDRIADKEIRLSTLQEQASRISPTGGGSAAAVQGLNESLAVIIDRTTRSAKLGGYLKRNQPDSKDSVRLRFESAPFDELIKWIGQVEQQYGLVTTTASFDEAGAAGMVNCSLVLQRGGG